MKPGVFIAMPVYRGTDFIEETLRSILAQTYEDFHLVMSVDGSDDPTVELCQKYASDPRIDLVVQDSRLGWPGNLNWLIRHCDREFFCYWQQDDLASTGYLEALLKELAVRPDAAIAYTDVQWFGAAFHRDGTPGIEGDALSRVIQHIEAIRFEPFRGLMRASMLPQDSDPIPVTSDESHQEEFVFLTKMAAAGAFLHCSGALYFKRLHTQNAFTRWREFPDWRRRRGWISMGTGMYRIAEELVPEAARPRVLAQVLDRLIVNRPGRGFFYEVPQEEGEIRRFVRDFLAWEGVSPNGLPTAEMSPGPMERPVSADILQAMQGERENAEMRSELTRRLIRNRFLHIKAENGSASSVLGVGWSYPESWGVWSEGEYATLRIPSPPGSGWEAVLRGRAHAPAGPVRVGVGTSDGVLHYSEAQPEQPISLRVLGDSSPTAVIRLHMPDARSPLDDGLSSDARTLGLGLTHLQLKLL